MSVTADNLCANLRSQLQFEALEAELLSQYIQYSTPVTGNTVAGTGRELLVTPAGTLAALTVTFPDSPVNNQTFQIASTQILTALTTQAGTGSAAITGGYSAAAFAIGAYAKWRYKTTGNVWIRI